MILTKVTTQPNIDLGQMGVGGDNSWVQNLIKNIYLSPKITPTRL